MYPCPALCSAGDLLVHARWVLPCAAISDPSRVIAASIHLATLLLTLSIFFVFSCSAPLFPAVLACPALLMALSQCDSFSHCAPGNVSPQSLFCQARGHLAFPLPSQQQCSAYSPLGKINIGLLADDVGVTTTYTLDLSQSVHDLVLAVTE